jgi:peroxiredoxin
MKKCLFLALVLLSAIQLHAQLPNVRLQDIDGNTIQTGSISNDGKPIIISFWATWCKPCLRELKAIHEVYPDWQDETGMKLIAISIDKAQNINKVKPLVDSEGWEYDILLDPNSDLTRALGIQMIPHVLILDGKGKIVDSRSGYIEGGEEHIIEKVREIIANAPKTKSEEKK